MVESEREATLVLTNSFGDKICQDLVAADIKFDQRRQGYRFSVHGYTSTAEIERIAGIFLQLKA